MNCVMSDHQFPLKFKTSDESMTLPIQNETKNASVSMSKKELLNEARAEALRANLKKRKDQSSARKIEQNTDQKQEETTN